MTPDEKARAEAREELKHVAEVASVQHLQESLAEFRAVTSPENEPDDWELEFWHAGYKRGALAIIEHRLAGERSQPVEITEEMVEAAAKAMRDLWWPNGNPKIEASDPVLLEAARAALSAALGGEGR